MDRQSGKSTMIAKLMKKYKRSVCIQPSEIQKRYFCKNFDIPKERVFTAGTFHSLKDKKDKIYIDEIGGFFCFLLGRGFEMATHTNEVLE